MPLIHNTLPLPDSPALLNHASHRLSPAIVSPSAVALPAYPRAASSQKKGKTIFVS
jgi:hypothetical protein